MKYLTTEQLDGKTFLITQIKERPSKSGRDVAIVGEMPDGERFTHTFSGQSTTASVLKELPTLLPMKFTLNRVGRRVHLTSRRD